MHHDSPHGLDNGHEHDHRPGRLDRHGEDHAHDHDHDHDHGHGHGHAHADGHGHSHGHVHAPQDFSRAFVLGIWLNLAFVVIEAVYGVLGDSLALLADAGHNLGDVLGLFLAWGASVLVKRAPTKRFTYGLGSTSIFAALANAALLLTVTGGIAWEAVLRLQDPRPVAGLTVIVVAAVGIAVNGATAMLFASGRHADLNIRGAFLHMAADAAISLGVVLAGIGILRTGWLWLDPVTSLVVSALVIASTWGLMRHALSLALHAVPAGIDVDEVSRYLGSLEGVQEVHDLHVWAMSTTETALTAHLVVPQGYPGDAVRHRICDELRRRFRIGHATLQFELGDSGRPCALAPADVV